MYSAPYSAVRMLSLMPPSTETYVRSPSSGLTVPTSYTVTPPGPAIVRPGSTVSRGTAQAARVADTVDDAAQVVGDVLGVERVVGVEVGDAVAAAEVELGQLDAELVTDGHQEVHDAPRGQLEAVGVEDLRADVGVQADELELLQLEDAAGGLQAVSRANPNFWSSCAVAMNSCVCASTPGGDADHHLGPYAPAPAAR